MLLTLFFLILGLRRLGQGRRPGAEETGVRVAAPGGAKESWQRATGGRMARQRFHVTPLDLARVQELRPPPCAQALA